MTKDEALRLALEALEDLGMKHYENTGEVLYKETFTAIKAALEAKDEPVAWIKRSAKGNIYDLLSEPDDGYEPVYTTPPQRTWVGLTDEEIGDALSVWELTEEWPTFAYAARAIEAKLKEKNT